MADRIEEVGKFCFQLTKLRIERMNETIIKQLKSARRISTPIVAIETPDPGATVESVCEGINGDARGDRDWETEFPHCFNSIRQRLQSQLTIKTFIYAIQGTPDNCAIQGGLSP